MSEFTDEILKLISLPCDYNLQPINDRLNGNHKGIILLKYHVIYF